VERRQASALRHSARRARSAGEWQHSFAWRGSWTTRLPAFRLPLFFVFDVHEPPKRSEPKRADFSGLMFLRSVLGMAWHSSGAWASREQIFISSLPDLIRQSMRQDRSLIIVAWLE